MSSFQNICVDCEASGDFCVSFVIDEEQTGPKKICECGHPKHKHLQPVPPAGAQIVDAPDATRPAAPPASAVATSALPAESESPRNREGAEAEAAAVAVTNSVVEDPKPKAASIPPPVSASVASLSGGVPPFFTSSYDLAPDPPVNPPAQPSWVVESIHSGKATPIDEKKSTPSWLVEPIHSSTDRHTSTAATGATGTTREVAASGRGRDFSQLSSAAPERSRDRFHSPSLISMAENDSFRDVGEGMARRGAAGYPTRGGDSVLSVAMNSMLPPRADSTIKHSGQHVKSVPSTSRPSEHVPSTRLSTVGQSAQRGAAGDDGTVVMSEDRSARDTRPLSEYGSATVLSSEPIKTHMEDNAGVVLSDNNDYIYGMKEMLLSADANATISFNNKAIRMPIDRKTTVKELEEFASFHFRESVENIEISYDGVGLRRFSKDGAELCVSDFTGGSLEDLGVFEVNSNRHTREHVRSNRQAPPPANVPDDPEPLNDVKICILILRSDLSFSEMLVDLTTCGFDIMCWYELPSYSEFCTEISSSKQLWILSGKESQLEEKYLNVIRSFHECGGGLFLLAGGNYNYADANVVVEYIYRNKAACFVHGKRAGGYYIRGQVEPQGVGISSHPLFARMSKLFEGDTVSMLYRRDHATTNIIMVGSESTMLIGVAGGAHGKGKIILDGGCNRLHDSFYSYKGTSRYVRNAATWL